jgi:hypothetical protein
MSMALVSKPVLAAALLFGWASAAFGPVLWIAVPLWIAVTTFLVKAKLWRRLLVLLSVSPVAVVSVLAAGSFIRGRARLLAVGYPAIELANVDPGTRLQTVSSGCMVDGSEIVSHLPNNIVVRLLSSLTPMPGSYQGPYPSRDEARHALRTASELNADELEADELHVGGKAFSLRNHLGHQIGVALGTQPTPKLRVALWKDTVLILQFDAANRYESELDETATVLALVDARTGKIFAYYGASALAHRLPSQWT